MLWCSVFAKRSMTVISISQRRSVGHEPSRLERRRQKFSQLSVPPSLDPRALVLATREGLPLGRWNLLRKHLKPAAKKLGFLVVTWHLLRHSHAAIFDFVGTPIGTMQSLLGHSTPEITREICLHAIPKNNVAQ